MSYKIRSKLSVWPTFCSDTKSWPGYPSGWAWLPAPSCPAQRGTSAARKMSLASAAVGRRKPCALSAASSRRSWSAHARSRLRLHKDNGVLTLILPSESAYGSQFFIAKLLQVHHFDWNETNMYSSSFVRRFKIYLPNCLKILLSNAFLTLILQKIESERLFIPHGVGAGGWLLKNDNVRDSVRPMW